MKLMILLIFSSLTSHASPLRSALAFACDATQEDLKFSVEISTTSEARAVIQAGAETFDCPLHLDRFIDGRRAQVLSTGYQLSRPTNCQPALSSALASRIDDAIQISDYPKPSEKILVSYLYRREHVACRPRVIRSLNKEILLKRLRQNPPSPLKREHGDPGPERTKSKLPVGGRTLQSI